MRLASIADELHAARRIALSTCDGAFATWSDAVASRVRRHQLDPLVAAVAVYERRTRATSDALAKLERQLQR